MKRLTIAMIGILMMLSFTGCINSYTSGPTAKFVQVDNRNRQYVELDAKGNVVMVADSIYKKLVAGQPTVKVGVNPRPKVYQAKDSLALVRPDAATVKKAVNSDKGRKADVIFGILLLICVPVSLLAIGKLIDMAKLGTKPTGWLLFGIAIIPFYFGMNAIQRAPHDASYQNEKQISMDTYRHYFSKDTSGQIFWDSLIRENRFIIKIAD